MLQNITAKAEAVSRQFVVGLLGASFGTSNLGVAALTCGTVTAINHTHPNARIFLVDYAVEPGTYRISHPAADTTVELINIRFSKKFYLRNNIARLLVTAICLRLIPLRGLRMRLLRRSHILNAFQEADIIGSIAGGDSFSDIYGLGRLVYVVLPQILVLLLKKPLLILPQTIGPFKSAFSKAVASYILRRAVIVYSRDQISLENVRVFLDTDHNKLSFCYDMGFVLEPHINKHKIPLWLANLDQRIPLVGLNVSGLLYIGGYKKNNMFVGKADYCWLINSILDYFIRKRNAHVMLVPHVFGAGDDSESDVTACREIYGDAKDDLTPNLHVLGDDYDQHEMKALIGRCKFFIGSRMHACIAALSQNVPAIGLSYSPKFYGVFASIGIEDLVIDLKGHSLNSVIKAVDRAYERRSEIRAQLQTKMPFVRASVLDLFSRFL